MNELEIARRFFLHKPDDIAQSYVQWADRLQREPGINFGTKVLDSKIIPLHPGDLLAVVARPGHGKSSFMAYLAKKTALDILARGAEDQVVVYLSWEQPVEEIEAFFQSGGNYTSTDMAWGKVPMDKIRAGSTGRGKLPIWMIGTSVRHAGIKKPRMYLDFVYAAIETMYQEHGKKPILLLLDYMQIIPVSSGGKRYEQVSEATNLTKELLMNHAVSGVAGVQAGRQVDGYKAKIPGMADAQHSSEIEQRADKQLALWRPIKDYAPAEQPEIEVAGVNYTNCEELFIVRNLKQRFDVGYGSYAMRFKPQTLEMYDYDQSYQNGHA